MSVKFLTKRKISQFTQSEDDQCWSKHVMCIHSDVEEILKFKNLKGLES
jgi:hypothetical protein